MNIPDYLTLPYSNHRKIFRYLTIPYSSRTAFFKTYPEIETISEIIDARVFEIGKALNRICDQIYGCVIVDPNELNVQKIDCTTMPYIPNHSRLNDPDIRRQNALDSPLCRFKSVEKFVLENDAQKASTFWKAVEYLLE